MISRIPCSGLPDVGRWEGCLKRQFQGMLVGVASKCTLLKPIILLTTSPLRYTKLSTMQTETAVVMIGACAILLVKECGNLLLCQVIKLFCLIVVSLISPNLPSQFLVVSFKMQVNQLRLFCCSCVSFKALQCNCFASQNSVYYFLRASNLYRKVFKGLNHLPCFQVLSTSL